MKNLKKYLVVLILLSSSLYAYNYSIVSGWQMLGAHNDTDTSVFKGKCIDFLWRYSTEDKEWKVYIANNKNYTVTFKKLEKLYKGEGFWAMGNSNCVIFDGVTEKGGEFDYKTEQKFNVVISSSKLDLVGKRVLIYLEKNTINTVVGETYVYDKLITDAVFDKSGVYNNLHTIPTSTKKLYINIPQYSIEYEADINFNKEILSINLD